MYLKNFRRYWKEQLTHAAVGLAAGCLLVSGYPAAGGGILALVIARQSLEWGNRAFLPILGIMAESQRRKIQTRRYPFGMASKPRHPRHRLSVPPGRMYRGDWQWGGMADLNGHEPFRMHEVGSDSWCRGCGLVMKAREWPAFAEQEKAKGIPPCKGDKKEAPL